MENNLTVKKKRLVYLDILRIIACFLVLVNHTNSMIVTKIEPCTLWYISLFYQIICKVAVPVFIMISGALLLSRNESYKTILKREFRLAVVLVAMAIFYFFGYGGHFEGLSSIKTIALNIFQNGISGAYWYIYMYMGILLMLPFLQKMRKNMTDRDCLIFIGLVLLVSGIWPMLVHIVPALSTFEMLHLPIFSGYLGFFFAGDLIAHRDTTKKGTISAIFIYIVILLLTFVLNYWEYLRLVGTGERFLFFCDPTHATIALMTMCTFYIVKHIMSKIKVGEKTSAVIKDIGLSTFGIYLLGDFAIQKWRFLYRLLEVRIYPMLAMIIFEIVVFLSCLIVVTILRRIPVVKKFL